MMMRIRDWEQTPPLYYYILRGWAAVFGDSETWLRAPSAIFSVGAVAGLYVLVRRIFNPTAALVAATLMAVSPFQIAYAQEARAYALFVPLAIASTIAFVQLNEKRSQWRDAVYVMVTGLMLYTHLYSIFVIAAHNLAYLTAIVWKRGAARLEPRPPTVDVPKVRHWLALNMAILAVYSAWLPTLWMWVKSVRAWFWVQPMTLDAISNAYELYAGSGALLIVLVMLCVTGAVLRRRRAPVGVVLCLALLLLPVIVPVVMSVIGRPTFVPRYAIAASVGGYALAGLGVSLFSACWVRVVATALLVVLSFFPTRLVEAKPQWRQAGAYLQTTMAQGDFAAVHRKGATCMYDYYVNRPDVLRAGFDGSALPVTQPLPEGKRIWLVLYTNLYPPRTYLDRGKWKVGRQKAFRDVLVMELMDDLDAIRADH
jgi:uncharacterized membrane protein